MVPRLIFILFLLIQFTVSHLITLPPECPNPQSQGLTGKPWWSPLEFNARDPCEQSMLLRFHDCQSDKPLCLVRYNFLAACVACSLFPDDSTAPSISAFNESAQKNFREILRLSSNFNNTPIPPNQQSARFPLWAREHYIPIFNPQVAVEMALLLEPASTIPTDPSSTSSSSSATAPSTMSPPSPAGPSDLPPSSSSVPHTQTPPSSSLKTTSSNAGAIAGGVIGAVLFISLIIIIILYYRRWRNERRVAPSAEFMLLAGPRATYTRAPNGSPPPAFIQRDGSDPVLEKAYYSAQAQMRLDSNHSSNFALDHQA